MKPKNKLTAAIVGLLLFSCSFGGNNVKTTKTEEIKSQSGHNSTKTITWNFDSLVGWQDATQSGDRNYYIDKTNLRIFTNANSWERVKIKTITTHTTGIYSWRIFTPEMGVGDMASIGAFLYADTDHELDFEIGYGKQIIRDQLNAKEDDLVVHMSSQGNPDRSFKTKIKRGRWHLFSMKLSLNSDRNYAVVWTIDNQLTAQTTLNYGIKKKFKIFCSLENLTFMGEHIPVQRNYALFDFVSYNTN
jgi:hypothetical protein